MTENAYRKAMTQLINNLNVIWCGTLKVTASLLAMTFFSVGVSFADNLVVIVHKDLNISGLTYNELSLIYKGRKKFWEDGQKIVLFLPPYDSEEMQVLTTKIFKKSNKSDVSKFYLEAIFQQNFTQPPKSFRNPKDAFLQISNATGGIGIVMSNSVSDENLIKVIPIE